MSNENIHLLWYFLGINVLVSMYRITRTHVSYRIVNLVSLMSNFVLTTVIFDLDRYLLTHILLNEMPLQATCSTKRKLLANRCLRDKLLCFIHSYTN